MKTTTKNEWRETTLGDIAEKIGMGPFGSNIKVDTFVTNGVPVISGAHLRGTRLEDGDYNFVSREHADRLASANVRRGDVIFTHAGNIGQVAYIPRNSKYERYILSQRQFYLRPGEGLSAEYLTYYFHSPMGRHQLLTYANQVGVPSIAQPVSNLRATVVSLPSIEEQRSIVAVVKSFDDKIELLRKQTETLERIAQTVFNERFVKPAYGSFPDDWREGKVRDVVEIFDTKRIPLSSEQRANRKGKYPYYGATTVMDHVDDYLFDGIYLLLAEDGSVADGRGYPVLQYVWGQFWVNNHAHILQGRNGFSTEMLYLFFRNKKVSEIITGAVQLKINQGNLLNVDIAIPPATILNTLNDFLNPLFTKVRANSNSILTLEHVRNLLLPRLMDGQLRVSN